ncbi:hypothetical protein FQN57_005471 [Myotisia sp. PD_48]|nr:hypothetical protein FQN57_005471 [Myotisia sp. PD_48]
MGVGPRSHSQASFYHHITLRLVLRVALALIAKNLEYNNDENIPQHLSQYQPELQIQRKIAKVTMIYGERGQIYEKALATHTEHSRRLGYPQIVLRDQLIDGIWNKPAILIRLILQELDKPLNEQLQWLFWFDADTVLMNPNLPLETFLPPSNLTHVHLVTSKDSNGLNHGGFFLHVHPWSITMLSAVIAYRTLKPEAKIWNEQSAFVDIIKENEKLAESVVYCPLRWFNAYARSLDNQDQGLPKSLQVHPGDLLVHFSGTPFEKLDSTLASYIAIAEAHQVEWEPPVESTTYIEETETFWENIQLKAT